MNSATDNDTNFKAQSYLRLLKFTAPYWKRLTFGILCGMLVGGSLFFALLLIPQLVGLVDTGSNLGASAEQRTISAETVAELRYIAENTSLSASEREQMMAAVLSVPLVLSSSSVLRRFFTRLMASAVHAAILASQSPLTSTLK